MRKISQRDNLTSEEQALKEVLSNNMYRSSLDEAWREFSQAAWGAIEGVVENYIDSEFKKTSIHKQLENLDANWDYLNKSNALSPERRTKMEEVGAELEAQASDFKNNLKLKLEGIKSELFADLVNSKL